MTDAEKLAAAREMLRSIHAAVGGLLTLASGKRVEFIALSLRSLRRKIEEELERIA